MWITRQICAKSANYFVAVAPSEREALKYLISFPKCVYVFYWLINSNSTIPIKLRYKVHRCTGTEALYRPYGL